MMTRINGFRARMTGMFVDLECPSILMLKEFDVIERIRRTKTTTQLAERIATLNGRPPQSATFHQVGTFRFFLILL
jgi:hypothetical protein